MITSLHLVGYRKRLLDRSVKPDIKGKCKLVSNEMSPINTAVETQITIFSSFFNMLFLRREEGTVWIQLVEWGWENKLQLISNATQSCLSSLMSSPPTASFFCVTIQGQVATLVYRQGEWRIHRRMLPCPSRILFIIHPQFWLNNVVQGWLYNQLNVIWASRCHRNRSKWRAF